MLRCAFFSYENRTSNGKCRNSSHRLESLSYAANRPVKVPLVTFLACDLPKPQGRAFSLLCARGLVCAWARQKTAPAGNSHRGLAVIARRIAAHGALSSKVTVLPAVWTPSFFHNAARSASAGAAFIRS